MIKKLFEKWWGRVYIGVSAKKTHCLSLDGIVEKAFRKGYEEGRKSMGYQPRRVPEASHTPGPEAATEA